MQLAVSVTGNAAPGNATGGMERTVSPRERIISALSDGRIWRPSELCEAASCHRQQVARLIAEGVVARFAGGYCLGEVTTDLLHREADIVLAARYPEGALCLTGAARRWDMAEGGVAKDCVLVPIGSAHSAPSGETVIRTSNRALLALGVTEERLAGVTVRTTSPERTLCDIFSPRMRGEPQVRTAALVGFVRNHGGEALDGALMLQARLSVAVGRPYCPDLDTAVQTLRETARQLEEEVTPHVPR